MDPIWIRVHNTVYMFTLSSCWFIYDNTIMYCGHFPQEFVRLVPLVRSPLGGRFRWTPPHCALLWIRSGSYLLQLPTRIRILPRHVIDETSVSDPDSLESGSGSSILAESGSRLQKLIDSKGLKCWIKLTFFFTQKILTLLKFWCSVGSLTRN